MKSDSPQPQAPKTQRLQTLARQFGARRKKGGWQAIAGKAAGDDLFREAMKLGAEWRDRASGEGK